MLGAKLRQVLLVLGTPRATVGYPLAPLAPEPAFRGRVTVETERCVGCGGCAEVCPARCVRIADPGPERRVLRRELDRCLLCGRCAEACAYDAVHLVADWETGTPDRRDLVITHNFLIAWLVREALEAPDWRWLGQNAANAALTVIRYAPERPPTLLVWNDTRHLPDELRWTGFPEELRI